MSDDAEGSSDSLLQTEAWLTAAVHTLEPKDYGFSSAVMRALPASQKVVVRQRHVLTVAHWDLYPFALMGLMMAAWVSGWLQTQGPVEAQTLVDALPVWSLLGWLGVGTSVGGAWWVVGGE